MINIMAMIASALVQSYNQSKADKRRRQATNVAQDRLDRERDKIALKQGQDLVNYEAPVEADADEVLRKELIKPINTNIDANKKFDVQNDQSYKGNIRNNAFSDALSLLEGQVSDKAKNKANLIALTQSPLFRRQDQALGTADTIQQNSSIGNNANSFYNNVSRGNIERAGRLNQGLSLLSRGLSSYAMNGGGGGGVNPATASSTGSMYSLAGQPMSVSSGVPIYNPTTPSLIGSPNTWSAMNNRSIFDTYSPNAGAMFR